MSARDIESELPRGKKKTLEKRNVFLPRLFFYFFYLFDKKREYKACNGTFLWWKTLESHSHRTEPVLCRQLLQ